MSTEKEFIAQSIIRMEENTSKIHSCLTLLRPEDLWRKPDSGLNSIGNLILHLCGNMTQYILSALDGMRDERQRNLEFSSSHTASGAELLTQLAATVKGCTEVIRKQDRASLIKVRNVQVYSLSGLGIILHVVEHYSYHTGQIVLLTKLWTGKDMGFYRDLNDEEQNKESKD
jgi:uncharacterized damage-inducible protein DinB